MRLLQQNESCAAPWTIGQGCFGDVAILASSVDDGCAAAAAAAAASYYYD